MCCINRGLPASNFELQTSNFKLQTSNFELQTSNFEAGSALPTRNLQPNVQFSGIPVSLNLFSKSMLGFEKIPNMS